MEEKSNKWIVMIVLLLIITIIILGFFIIFYKTTDRDEPKEEVYIEEKKDFSKIDSYAFVTDNDQILYLLLKDGTKELIDKNYLSIFKPFYKDGKLYYLSFNDSSNNYYEIKEYDVLTKEKKLIFRTDSDLFDLYSAEFYVLNNELYYMDDTTIFYIEFDETEIILSNLKNSKEIGKYSDYFYNDNSLYYKDDFSNYYVVTNGNKKKIDYNTFNQKEKEYEKYNKDIPKEEDDISSVYLDFDKNLQILQYIY